jgi:hypothetical protein
MHGNVFPAANTPLEITQEQQQLLRIPPEFASDIPDKSMPIARLLCFTSFPPFLDDTPYTWLLSAEQPCRGISKFTTIEMPPVACVQHLLDSLDQALFDGMHSVVHPTYHTPLLPLWVLEYWVRMRNVVDARDQWAEARKWLLKCEDPANPLSSLVHDALKSFETVGWNTPLPAPASFLSSLELSVFLSTRLVHGHVIDAMMASIADRVRLTPNLRGRISVESLTFLDTLRFDDDRWKQYNYHRSFTHTRNLGDRLFEGSLERIIAPVNIGGLHWTVFFIDGPGKWIKYGDSLEWAWPFQDVERIQKWLRLHGFQSFRKAGDLPHGVQADSYSCAIAMVNIIRHSLFSDPLFVDNNKHFLHIQEYLLLIRNAHTVGHILMFRQLTSLCNYSRMIYSWKKACMHSKVSIFNRIIILRWQT